MSITSGFWDSVNGDRRYSGRQILHVFDGLISDGIVKGYLNSFGVRVASSALRVRDGRAFLANGIWVENTTDDQAVSDVTAADGSRNRCDAVVLTLNESGRTVTVNYVEGTADSNLNFDDPGTSTTGYQGHPELTSNQYLLAFIIRKAGSGTSVTSTNMKIVNARGTKLGNVSGIPYASVAGVTDSTYVQRQQETVNRVIITNSNGIVTVSAITTTELSRLSGARGNIQDQIDMVNTNADGQVIVPFNNTAASQITLEAAHAGRMLSSYGVAHTFVIPPASSANWTGGAEILFLRYSTYDVTISPGTGVTLYGIDKTESGSFKIMDRFGVACAKKLTGSNDVWVIFGNIEPV